MVFNSFYTALTCPRDRRSFKKMIPFIRKMPFRATNFNRGSSSLAQFKKRQADFQCDNGQPIWLKGGLCDRILYGSTIVASYIGILMTLGTIYDNAKPASWKTPSG